MMIKTVSEGFVGLRGGEVFRTIETKSGVSLISWQKPFRVIFTTENRNAAFIDLHSGIAKLRLVLKVVRNSFPFSIPAVLYERLTRL